MIRLRAQGFARARVPRGALRQEKATGNAPDSDVRHRTVHSRRSALAVKSRFEAEGKPEDEKIVLDRDALFTYDSGEAGKAPRPRRERDRENT